MAMRDVKLVLSNYPEKWLSSKEIKIKLAKNHDKNLSLPSLRDNLRRLLKHSEIERKRERIPTGGYRRVYKLSKKRKKVSY